MKSTIKHFGLVIVLITSINLFTGCEKDKDHYKDCDPNGCTTVTISSFYSPDNTVYHSVSNLKIEGSNLKFMVGFSGCDADINPKLILVENTKINYPGKYYDAYFDFNRTPQMCHAAFLEEVCFDVAKVQKQGTVFVNIHGTQESQGIEISK